MIINAYLISLSDGFKEIKKITLKSESFPYNKYNQNQGELSNYPFTYLWITQKFFPNSIIKDFQYNNSDKGYPDFVVYDPDNLLDPKYVEFKSESDNLSISQIYWNMNNVEKDRYLIYLKQDCSL